MIGGERYEAISDYGELVETQLALDESWFQTVEARRQSQTFFTTVEYS